MLPYAPVQILLFDYPDGINMPDCLVMTSGNVSGAPICRDDAEAIAELGNLCDCILSHNRKIRIRADDSVMDFYDGEPYMIRRSRGYAPLPYMLSAWEGSEKETGGTRVLAIGGELKNTFCIGSGSLFYPSSYIGDLADLRSVKALEETTGRYARLLEVVPQVIACDLHPRYNSVTTAIELAEQIGKEQGKEALPVVRVQHHYAHVLSCMAENDFADPVIGVSMDGTGYGTDGTIWGGEILTADNRKQYLIPRGFAHGFLVLSDEAEFCYKCDDFYHPDDEGGLAWNDPEIGIFWPEVVGEYSGNAGTAGYRLSDGSPLILSEKDQKWLGLKETFQF
jgi:hydrogenase maturation protein HypF